MEYEVRITVVKQLVVPVEAESMAIAKMLAEQNYTNNEYEDTETHSRRLREKTTFETLYPDIALCR